MNKISTVETMALDGGSPAIDLVNSGYAVQPGQIVERLFEYGDFLRLAARHGIIDRNVLLTLTAQALASPKTAENTLKEIKEFRIALYNILCALSKQDGSKIDDPSLNIFNRYLSKALSFRVISIENTLPVRDWKSNDHDLKQPFRQYCLFAYEVLTGSKNKFIKQCAGCAWLFVDESKNRKRKWCDMQICGASDKAKRYYQKKKLSALNSSHS